MAKGIKTRRGESKGTPPTSNLYLYNRGDECSDVTGGWSVMAYRSSYTTSQAITKNTDNIQLTCKGTAASTGEISYTHATAVDVTAYTTLHAICKNKYADDYVIIGIDNVKNSGELGSSTPTSLMTASARTHSATEVEVTLDISSITGNQYIHMIFSEEYSGGNVLGSGYFYEVWLE